MSSYNFFSQNTGTAEPDLSGFSLGFSGKIVDERGEAASSLLNAQIANIHTIAFNPSNQTIYIDNEQTNLSRLTTLMQGGNSVVVDATTLGLGEILQVLLAAKRCKMSEITFIYTEPKEYSRANSQVSSPFLRQRDFRLTENYKFIGIQGFAHEYDKRMEANHIFLLGFEPARLQNAVEQRGDVQTSKYRKFFVIGIPAFRPGWEKNSVIPHAEALERAGVTAQSITYCQANSIREAYHTLWQLYERLGSEKSCFYVSPLGTKPHTVGAALFLIETRGADKPTSLFYDHPVRVNKRSREIATWHQIKVTGLC